jgi:hypothetical protein
MTQRYHVVPLTDSPSALGQRRLALILGRDGPFFLPVLGLIGEAQADVDGLIDVMRRATIEVVLLRSADQLAGRPRAAD